MFLVEQNDGLLALMYMKLNEKVFSDIMHYTIWHESNGMKLSVQLGLFRYYKELKFQEYKLWGFFKQMPKV